MTNLFSLPLTLLRNIRDSIDNHRRIRFENEYFAGLAHFACWHHLNITLKHGENILHFDHLIISEVGVFGITTDNTRGLIVGNGRHNEWEHHETRESEMVKIPNPLPQRVIEKNIQLTEYLGIETRSYILYWAATLVAITHTEQVLCASNFLNTAFGNKPFKKIYSENDVDIINEKVMALSYAAEANPELTEKSKF